MTIYSIYDQLADLLTTANPAQLTTLKATTDVQNRFEILVDKAKDTTLTNQEKDELDHYAVLERLIQLAKLRAPSGPVLV